MLEDFLSYIEADLSVFREDKLLLAVSGGVDSMVMLHLFQLSGYTYEVAHINHSTRNGKSDHDMKFVQDYCTTHSIPFHFKILDYEKLQKGNFQENARNARFEFLESVKNDRKCKYIATAHHKNDRWETFLMHLNRKSGLKGLTSLRPKAYDLIHPLLIFSKKQIAQFAQKNKVPFVHDESNDSDDYLRNAIRHQLTPKIEALFPDFVQNVNHSITHLEKSASLLKELIANNNFIYQNPDSGHFVVALDQIKKFKNRLELLYYILDEFGYNHDMARDILQTNTTGTRFNTSRFEGLFDRGSFLIRTKRDFEAVGITISKEGIYTLPSGKKLNVSTETSKAIDKRFWLDMTQIEWPVTIRSIQPGDRFKPSGMKGATKTIKKLCTDLKVNRFEKEEMLVVCSDKEIIQIIGLVSSYGYQTGDIKNALTFSIID
ncbi:MAG: tRNA lysidine(34) synthetase TilS [Bacteroidota bacterium]